MNRKFLSCHSFKIFFNILITLWLQVSTVLGVIGGDEAFKGQFKYQVSVLANDLHKCGGAIVTDKHVVSAAHCYINENQKFINAEYLVVAGCINYQDSANQVVEKVEKIYIPSEFKYIDFTASVVEKHSADIAVLRLKYGVGMYSSLFVTKVKLPYQCDLSYDYTEPVITGFGYNIISTYETSSGDKALKYSYDTLKLKYARTIVYPNAKCQSVINIPIDDSHICARAIQRSADKLEGACQGDSGGPLVLDNFVIGVLSVTPPHCNQVHYPAIYTKVGCFLPFIHAAFEDKETPNIRTATFISQKKYLNLIGQKITQMITT